MKAKCPFCNGTGELEQEEVDKLIAFVPVKCSRCNFVFKFWKAEEFNEIKAIRCPYCGAVETLGG